MLTLWLWLMMALCCLNGVGIGIRGLYTFGDIWFIAGLGFGVAAVIVEFRKFIREYNA